VGGKTTGTAGAVSIVFTPASSILVNGVITINVPSGYFALRNSAAAAGMTLTCASSCSSSVVNTAVTVTASQITVVVTNAPTTANSAHTLTFPAGVLTTGTPQAGTAAGITVSTTQDFASAGSASLALGAQVSVGTSLTFADAADRVGGKATTGAVSIVFTPASSILANGVITINVPSGYFALRDSGTAGGMTLTCASTCSVVVTSAVAVTASQITVVVTGGATTANSAHTLTFPPGILTTGAPQAGTAAGITVSTTQDFASAGSASQALGGRVTVGSSVTMFVSLTPVANIPGNGRLVITLSGTPTAWPALSSTAVTFALPASGSPTATASILSSVLTVVFTGGTFNG